MTQRLEEIEKKEDKFVDRQGRTLEVELVSLNSFDTDASPSSPLCCKYQRFAEEAAKQTSADAYIADGQVFENYQFPDAPWSPCKIKIELYRIKKRTENK